MQRGLGIYLNFHAGTAIGSGIGIEIDKKKYTRGRFCLNDLIDKHKNKDKFLHMTHIKRAKIKSE